MYSFADGVNFGNYPTVHRFGYYSDILQTSEIKFQDVKEADIVEFVKQQINMNLYVSLFIYKEGKEHEVFVYGYDDEMSSFMSIALNESKHFKPSVICYDRLRLGFVELNKVVKNAPDYLYPKRVYNLPFSIIEPCNVYLSRNYEAEYFEKISNEVYGTVIKVSYTDENEELLDPYIYYSGISCLLAVKNELLSDIELRENASIAWRIRRSLFKLLEHRSVLHDGMIYFESEWKIADKSNEMIQARCDYEKQLERMQRIALMSLKYETTHQRDLAERLAAMISAQYHDEKLILQVYAQHMKKCFFAG